MTPAVIISLVMACIGVVGSIGVVLKKIFDLGGDVKLILQVVEKVGKHSDRLDVVEDDILDFKHRLTKLEKYEQKLDKLNDEATFLKQEIAVMKGLLKKTSPSIFSGDNTK